MVILRVIKTGLILVYSGLVLLITPLSAWLLFSAQTLTGAAIATSSLRVMALPLVDCLWY